MADWYCMVGGQRYGPLSQQQLNGWIAEGRVTRAGMICGMIASILAAVGLVVWLIILAVVGSKLR